MEESFNVDNISNYDWYDSYSDGTLYVKYMNAEVFNLVPSYITLRFACVKHFQTSKYYTEIDLTE